MTAVGELWHIVAAGLPLDFAPADDGETGAGLARRAVESGAFVGIAHPAWSQLTIEDGRAIEAAHAVEIYNHGCAMECDRGDGWYLMDQLLNDGRRLTAFATDDAHFTQRRARRLRRLGRGQGGVARARKPARGPQGRALLRQPRAAHPRTRHFRQTN
jgi:hypothetical protein